MNSDLYTLYDDNISFVRNLTDKIKEQYGLNIDNILKNALGTTNITNDNKAKFLQLYQMMNNRYKFYDNKIQSYLNPIQVKEMSINNGNYSFKNIKNADMKNIVDIVKNILFQNKNSNYSDQNLWLYYWQLFGLTLLILNNKLNLNILNNLGKEYDYDLYQKINNIIIDNYKSLVNSSGFFKYLNKRYCSGSNSNKELMEIFFQTTGRTISQLSEREKLKIKQECRLYPNINGNNDILKSQCVKDMLCSFIVFHKSKVELQDSDYKINTNKIRDQILLYYLTLANIYSNIIINLHERVSDNDIFYNKNSQDILNKIYSEGDLYRYQYD